MERIKGHSSFCFLLNPGLLLLSYNLLKYWYIPKITWTSFPNTILIASASNTHKEIIFMTLLITINCPIATLGSLNNVTVQIYWIVHVPKLKHCELHRQWQILHIFLNYILLSTSLVPSIKNICLAYFRISKKCTMAPFWKGRRKHFPVLPNNAVNYEHSCYNEYPFTTREVGIDY